MLKNSFKFCTFGQKAGAVISDICFFVQNRDGNSVRLDSIPIHNIVGCEGGKRGVCHQLSENIHFLLDEETCGWHVPAAEPIPESDPGIEQERLTVQVSQIETVRIREGMYRRQADEKVLAFYRNGVEFFLIRLFVQDGDLIFVFLHYILSIVDVFIF